MSLLKTTLLKNFVKYPLYFTFFVTSKCNARCEHCFNWKNLNKNNDLSLYEIERFSKSIGDIHSIGFSGGEPFLRKDLPEITRMFYRNNNVKIMTIPTNGLLPKLIFKTTKRILELCFKTKINVSLSLDGPKEIHDRIRNVNGAFEKVIDTYKLLKTLKKKYPNFKIMVSSTISQKNIAKLYELIDFIKENMISVDILNFGILRGDPRNESYKTPPLREIVKLENYANEQTNRKPKGLSDHMAKLFNKSLFGVKMKTLKINQQVVPCEAGRLAATIMENGDVKHCEMLDSIGNLRKDSFLTIWNSPYSKKKRQNIVNGECFCTHECFLYPSVIAHPLIGFLNSLTYK